MKRTNLFFLLAILMSMAESKVYAYDIAVANADGITIYYNYISNGTELEVAENISYSGVVNIPEAVTYMNTTRSVTSIGKYAFAYCSGLTSVTIPNSVAHIGTFAFSGCFNLTSVTIPNSVKSINARTFEDCSSLTSVTIPNGVTYIGDNAFSGCYRLTSITIPNGVTYIGYNAFYGCYRLTSITIPSSVTYIGDTAFCDCHSLTSVHISDIAAWNEIEFTDMISNPLYYAHHIFLNGEEIKDLIIPNSVTSIGKYAFAYCSGLTSVTIPNSVTSIGDGAFSGCDIPTIISLIKNPFKINNNTFSTNTTKNATLFVPIGTIDKYEATEGWRDFVYKKEGSGLNGITQVRANAIFIQSNNGTLNISGADDGTNINVYTTYGVLVGSARATATSASIATNLSNGEIAIVKIGDKAVKVVMK